MTVGFFKTEDTYQDIVVQRIASKAAYELLTAIWKSKYWLVAAILVPFSVSLGSTSLLIVTSVPYLSIARKQSELFTRNLKKDKSMSKVFLKLKPEL